MPRKTISSTKEISSEPINILTWIADLRVGDIVIRDEPGSRTCEIEDLKVIGVDGKKIILSNGELWDAENNRPAGRSKHERIFLRPPEPGEAEGLAASRDWGREIDKENRRKKVLVNCLMDIMLCSKTELSSLPEGLLILYRDHIIKAKEAYDKKYGPIITH